MEYLWRFVSWMRDIRSRGPAIFLPLLFAVFLIAYFYIIWGIGLEKWPALQAGLPGALNTVIGLGVTVLVTTFSFVFVALSLVSVQFSPRAVRRFWQGDRFRALFLWSYILIFGAAFLLQFFAIPKIHLLLVACGVYLIFVMFPSFLGYLAENLNVASLTDGIARNTLAEVERSYGKAKFRPQYDPDATTIVSQGKGFLADIDAKRLEKAFLAIKAENPEAEMKVVNYVGSFVEQASALAEIRPRVALGPYEETEITSSFRLSKFRNIDKDIEYGIRQLVDIAIKAISPAVNDPTTCVNCLHYLGVVIRSLAVRPEKSEWAAALELEGIYVKEPGFEKYLDDAFNQIYQWGKSDYVIVKNILNILSDIVSVCPDSKKIGAIAAELREMQLEYLYGDSQNAPIKYGEHRGYVVRAYKFLLKAMIKRAALLETPEIGAEAEAILAKIEAAEGK